VQLNNQHKAVLADLKSSIDDEFGESAVWLFESGNREPVFGTFSLIEKSFNVKQSRENRSGGITVDVATATYAMTPSKVKGNAGDSLRIRGQDYLVLPFSSGDFETIIPLKLTQNKNHSWR